MESRLVLEADGRRDRKRQRDMAQEAGGHTRFVGGGNFLFQLGDLVGILGIKIGGDAREVAVDAVLLDQ